MFLLTLLLVASCSSRPPQDEGRSPVLTYRNVYLLTENYDVWTPASDATATEIIVLPHGALDFSPDVGYTFDATVRVFRELDAAVRKSGQTTSSLALVPRTATQFAAMAPYSSLNLAGCEVRRISEVSTLVARCTDAHTIMDIEVESLDEAGQPLGDLARAARVLQDIYAAITKAPNTTLIANTQSCTKDSECYQYHVSEEDVCVTRFANIYAALPEYERSYLPTLCSSDYTRPQCIAHACTQALHCGYFLRDDGWNDTCTPEHLRAVNGTTGDNLHPGNLAAACAAYAQCAAR